MENQKIGYFEAEYVKLLKAVDLLDRSNSYNNKYYWKVPIQSRLKSYIRAKTLYLSTLI